MDINRGLGAGLIRLVFHDCFVRGCDGSVLLDSTPKNTTSNDPLTLAGKTEKASPSNGGLRGLEVIDAIRLRLAEKDIGVNVSCADAVVFAAREATYILSNNTIKYEVDGPGRKDGVVSSAEDPGKHLPNPTDNFQQLLQSFMAKGFNLVELVALSGAHSVGIANLTSVIHRFGTPIIHGEMNKTYGAVVAAEGPKHSGVIENNVRDFDDSSRKLAGYQANGVVDLAAVGYLDNSYYNANLQNMVLFKSDWELTQNGTAEEHMKSYKKKASLWNTAFANAMTKLSKMVESKDPLYDIPGQTGRPGPARPGPS
ncbi:hypothetical protein CFC21_000869 [Triticum aestivum]|uniref:Peroxidase n=2 Tax=Triticum TaxID=4564 RepID=A0A9R0ULN1_TRITD|nr:hypothetical protein CFC21_000869 [Triticum aestivum]VAH01877.1 unnamed protein product [Triticum turgidum subsp. durum]